MTPGSLDLLEDAKSLQEFWGYFLFRELEVFRGSEDPRVFVSHFLREDAKSPQEGQLGDEDGEAVRPEVVRCVFDYVSLIRRVAEFVCDRARRELTEDRLRIVQTRTYFDFGAWMVRLLFIVDADPHSEMFFSDLLARTEKIVTLEGCFVPQLMYINKRAQNIDGSSVTENYPFVCRSRSKD